LHAAVLALTLPAGEGAALVQFPVTTRNGGISAPSSSLAKDRSQSTNGTLRGDAPSFDEAVFRKELGFHNPLAQDRLLLFWPVQYGHLVPMYVQENAKNLDRFSHPSHERPLHVDIFLVHYDGKRSSWQQKCGMSWYGAHVRYSADTEAGLKMWLARDLLLADRSQVRVDSYSYVWLLDEDAGLATLDVARMLKLARQSEANIVTPAFVNVCWNCTKSRELLVSAAKTTAATRAGAHAAGGMLCQTGEPMCKFQLPRSDCLYRYTNFVEVSFPLIKPAALRLLGRCDKCMPNPHSTWGLNDVWCHLTAREPVLRSKSCAIIDETPILHYNFRTHPKSGKLSRRIQAVKANWDALQRVKTSFGAAYAHDLRTYQCVAR